MPGRTITLRYFAWVRERVGRAEERVEVPGDIETVGALIGWLGQRGEGYALAFQNPKIIRAAIDGAHAKAETRIVGAEEIALFPPVTGG